MNAKATLTKLGQRLNDFVYVLGWFTIWTYTSERWPLATNVVAGLAITFIGSLYLWFFFVVPFREGLRGSPPEDKPA
jgi:hypothetical protein